MNKNFFSLLAQDQNINTDFKQAINPEKTLHTLQIGDKITHYCVGEIVEGEVISTGFNEVTTKHAPIRWGKTDFETTTIHKNPHFQADTHRPTMPAAWHNGQKLQA